MDIRKVLIILLTVIIVVSSLTIVSAGLFGLGETEKESITFNDDSNNALFSATADKGSYEKSSSYSGLVVPSLNSSIEYPSLGYICSYNGTELFINYNPMASYKFALDYYSGNSSYKVTEKNNSFIYNGTDKYGHNEWGVITSDGKHGFIDVTKNVVVDFNEKDYNLINEFMNTIKFDIPNHITVDGVTLNSDS